MTELTKSRVNNYLFIPLAVVWMIATTAFGYLMFNGVLILNTALVIFGFATFMTIILLLNYQQKRRHLNLPTLNVYLQNNQKCKTNNGIICCHCGSRSIRNWGVGGANSFLREHICNSCGETLYRTMKS